MDQTETTLTTTIAPQTVADSIELAKIAARVAAENKGQDILPFLRKSIGN
jgi:hypothetical protein